MLIIEQAIKILISLVTYNAKQIEGKFIVRDGYEEAWLAV
jgi:hypothetical protein